MTPAACHSPTKASPPNGHPKDGLGECLLTAKIFTIPLYGGATTREVDVGGLADSGHGVAPINATLLEFPVQTFPPRNAKQARLEMRSRPASKCEAGLSALVKRLWCEVGQVRREPAELRQEASEWKVVTSKRSYKKPWKQIDRFSAENRQLEGALCGTRTRKKLVRAACRPKSRVPLPAGHRSLKATAD